MISQDLRLNQLGKAWWGGGDRLGGPWSRMRAARGRHVRGAPGGRLGGDHSLQPRPDDIEEAPGRRQSWGTLGRPPGSALWSSRTAADLRHTVGLPGYGRRDYSEPWARGGCCTDVGAEKSTGAGAGAPMCLHHVRPNGPAPPAPPPPSSATQGSKTAPLPAPPPPQPSEPEDQRGQASVMTHLHFMVKDRHAAQ